MSARLAEDAGQVRNLVGDRLGTIIQAIATLVNQLDLRTHLQLFNTCFFFFSSLEASSLRSCTAGKLRLWLCP